MIINENGVERKATDQELLQSKIDQETAKLFNAEMEARVAAKTSALAKLAALGLTADEIASL
jgi:hypothetical protein